METHWQVGATHIIDHQLYLLLLTTLLMVPHGTDQQQITKRAASTRKIHSEKNINSIIQ
jgi:hypothetical protein